MVGRTDPPPVLTQDIPEPTGYPRTQCQAESGPGLGWKLAQIPESRPPVAAATGPPLALNPTGTWKGITLTSLCLSPPPCFPSPQWVTGWGPPLEGPSPWQVNSVYLS